MDDTALHQLEALREVAEVFERNSIWYGLFGGWAVDFYVGAVTRPHDDIDLAVWLNERSKIAGLLEDAGWRHAPYPDEDGGTGYERNGVRVEFTFLVREGDAISLPLRNGPVSWSYEHREDKRELHGIRVPTVSLPSLRAGKSFVRGQPSDVAKDRADLEALQRVAVEAIDDEAGSRG